MKYDEEFKKKVIEYYNNFNGSKGAMARTCEHFKIISERVRCWTNIEYKAKKNKLTNLAIRNRLINNTQYKEHILQLSRKRYKEQDPELQQINTKRINLKLKERKLKDLEFKAKWYKQIDLYIKERRKTDPIYNEKFKRSLRNQLRKRRALEKHLDENYTPEDEQYTMNLFENKCAVCGSVKHLQIDHWYPLSKGHALTRTNAVLLCKKCNCPKYNHLPNEYFPKELFEAIEQKLNHV